jgi:hypothetical protein
LARQHSRYDELDAAAERAILRRERLQLLDRLGPVAELVSAALDAGGRGDWAEARASLEKADKFVQIILDEASDRVLMDDASQERAEILARKEEGEERFND